MAVVNIEVELRHGEDSERLIHRFMKKFKKTRLMDEIKSHEFFVSDSELRHEKKKRKKFLCEKKREEELLLRNKK